MKILSNKEFEALAKVQGERCISIYIPTHRAGHAVNNGKDARAFKNQLQKVKNQLEDQGMQEVEVQAYLKPAYDLLDDGAFWRHQLEGLAVFLCNTHFSYHRLPISVEEYCSVANCFQLRQILPVLNGDGIYFILAFSLEDVRLFEATHYYIHELDINGRIQKSMDEVMKYYDFDTSLQNRHSATSGVSNANYHGHGNIRPDKKQMVEEFSRNVVEGLKKIVATDRSPIVLAAVEYLHPIFNQAANGLNIMKKGIVSSPENMQMKELHTKSWECVKDHFEQDKERSRRMYNELAGTGKTTYDVERIVPAAMNGQIESLFVARGTAEIWGRFHEATQTVDVHNNYKDGDDELISRSAVQTILNGGRTYVVDPSEMPDQTVNRNVMAVLRF